MSLSVLNYLHHILDEADFLSSKVGDFTQAQFIRDETAKRAFVRSIEIIGEATKQVPKEIRQRYPDVEWRAMASMRDKVIHHYFGVDYEIVWDVALNKIPKLRQQIEFILEQEKSG